MQVDPETKIMVFSPSPPFSPFLPFPFYFFLLPLPTVSFFLSLDPLLLPMLVAFFTTAIILHLFAQEKNKWLQNATDLFHVSLVKVEDRYTFIPLVSVHEIL